MAVSTVTPPHGQPSEAFRFTDGAATRPGAADLELDNGAGPVAGDQAVAIGASGQTHIRTGPIALDAGAAMAELAAPGAGNVGGVDIRALTGAAYDYLLGEWVGDDAGWDDPPSARVEFGIYRGDDRLIDIRRVPVN